MSFASQINARFEVGWRTPLVELMRDGEWHRVNALLETFGPTIPLELALRHFDREVACRRYAPRAVTHGQKIAKGRKAVLLHALTNLGVERTGYKGRLLTPYAAVRLRWRTCLYCGAAERAPGNYRKTSFFCCASHKNLFALRARGVVPLRERTFVCRGCGVTFAQTRYKRTQFHNNACFNTWNAARTRATMIPREVRVCAAEGCTETFVAPVGHKRRYHSKECANRCIVRDRQRKRAERLRETP